MNYLSMRGTHLRMISEQSGHRLANKNKATIAHNYKNNSIRLKIIQKTEYYKTFVIST